ncbi:30S ribosomal protein S2 [candidate division WWE3 bacterium CG06_land_8_20_14_3_00_42_16]|uniref:Small ribosomal subunit protein uS2 n=4 Tax=Katanobacteria TaxID=422282 RepID=A0A2M7ALH0_UNCKA|nr:MAG: 30S ribosomal protein S2 [bacterium CG1_02_42_9]PIU68187.1 MAG: 30S ribosomal protein S2 [candidate division WWE3 bacterium CG06_land_8_20_14_3_00_42_16]PIZ43635.1 MAG: 30S ribosomal protein S2 [candidate division WWE3 bacterium CG_4_10_14_0_2_um_filter_42_8]PJA38489.1 MAG: 30S ribosomal protein S2 [candidate division WWE3 bacterium CG_4_9_14_3_um_filter_43_9]PJC68378.1 MAG: 30S ribosomal protein S2 [candidate division WWE3 bacterium CG_4_8_14_3_um_filter_42_11]
MSQLTLQGLLEAGSHFGHQTKRWDPKMKSHIFTQRNGIHIIDLESTLKMADEAAVFVKKLATEGKTLLFVGTKRQAREIIKTEAKKCGCMYINERWVGGLLTNFDSVRKVIDKYNEMITVSKGEEFGKLTKKEQSLFQKDFSRLDKSVGGIRELKRLPDALFILDVKREKIAVTEAKKVSLPIVAICDTNSNPELVDYPIPGNDDGLKSIQLFVSFMADVYLAGRKEGPQEAGQKPTQPAENGEKKVEEKAPAAKLKSIKVGMQADDSLKSSDLPGKTVKILKEEKIEVKPKKITKGQVLEVEGLGKITLEDEK